MCYRVSLPFPVYDFTRLKFWNSYPFMKSWFGVKMLSPEVLHLKSYVVFGRGYHINSLAFTSSPLWTCHGRHMNLLQSPQAQNPFPAWPWHHWEDKAIHHEPLPVPLLSVSAHPTLSCPLFFVKSQSSLDLASSFCPLPLLPTPYYVNRPCFYWEFLSLLLYL